MIAPNLLVIRASQPERLANFYSAMGLRFERERHGNGPEHLTCSLNGFVFEIYPLSANGEATTSTRLGFAVPSIDEAVDALSRTGGRLLMSPATTEWGRRAVVVDPEGHKVELAERPFVPPPPVDQPLEEADLPVLRR